MNIYIIQKIYIKGKLSCKDYNCCSYCNFLTIVFFYFFICRFTEIFVDEIDDKQDLTILVQEYLKSLSLNASSIENIVKFYIHIKTSASQNLTDGTGHYPHYRYGI